MSRWASLRLDRVTFPSPREGVVADQEARKSGFQQELYERTMKAFRQNQRRRGRTEHHKTWRINSWKTMQSKIALASTAATERDSSTLI